MVPGVDCVVLCGGLSTRFGRDKLTAQVEGKAVVARVVDALKSIGPVHLSVASNPRGDSLRQAAGLDQPIVVDLSAQHVEGPPLAILTCLEKLGGERVLFVPGDVPWVVSAALLEFVRRCVATDCDVGTLAWPSGAVETLFQFHRRDSTLPSVRRIAGVRGTLMRASDVLRAAETTLYVGTQNVTTDPLCFSNINTEADLLNPRARGAFAESKDVVVGSEATASFRRAADWEAGGRTQEAMEVFREEGMEYERSGLGQIALQCYQDSLRNAERAGLDAAELRAMVGRLTHRSGFSPKR